MRYWINRSAFQKSHAQPGQYLYLFHPNSQLCVGGAGADPHMYIMRAFFLMPLALSMPIFNKKSQWTRAVETFKIRPNFETTLKLRM